MSTALLLTHLQHPNPNVPLQTLTAALSHHLAADQPTPTPLAAAAISSPFFLTYPPTHDRLQALLTAFRHAAQLKYQALVKHAEEGWSVSRAIFSRGVEGGMKEWVRDVLRGLQGGRPVLRLACCTGLLSGITGLRGIDANKRRVEDEVIIALAEVLDDYTAETGDWEKEFRPHVDETLLSLTLILASQSLPLIPKSKLSALPLPLLARLLTATIASAFQHGNFLKSIPDATSAGAFNVPPDSPFTQTIQRTSTSPTMLSMPSLSKLTALIFEILLDSPRAQGGLEEAHKTLETFRAIAAQVERDYAKSNLASASGESDIPPATSTSTSALFKSAWLLLKTLLFTTTMLASSALSTIVYIPPPPPAPSSRSPDTRNAPQPQPQPQPQDLAESLVRTFAHLAFVVSQFGGVAAAASPTGGEGFTELRKAFYLALDILSSTATTERCDGLVRGLIAGAGAGEGQEKGRRDKTAYALACVEQVVPCLSVRCLREEVWGFCVPHLSDPAHRAAYESAHSVVLAVFAAHAAAAQHADRPAHRRLGGRVGVVSGRSGLPDESRGGSEKEAEEEGDEVGSAAAEMEEFVHRLVPFYAQCLIENSEDGRLSTAQLRLAYAALVRSASACASAAQELGWYCLAVLLDAVRGLDASLRQEREGEREGEEERRRTSGSARERERLHRLHLTLVSTVPALPLPLMVRVLEEIRSIITRATRAESGGGAGKGVGVGDDGGEERRRRKELVDALFAEILEKVGDREKEAAMRWWYAHREDFARSIGGANAEGRTDVRTEDGALSDAVSRL